MSSSLQTKFWAGFSLVVVFALTIVWFAGRSLFGVQPTANVNTNVNSADSARERYANLTEAAWRQDQGQGSILMTATLLLPPALEALARDSQRSDMDDQIYRATRRLAGDQAAILITIDSIAGPVADATIRQSLELSSGQSASWQLIEWLPILRPNVFSNSSETINAQAGVAIWQASQVIDWNQIKQLRLTSRDIGEIAERVFVWADPRVLLQADAE